MTFREWIAKQAEAIGVNELGRRLDIGGSSVSAWVAGAALPMADLYRKLADATGADVNALEKMIDAERIARALARRQRFRPIRPAPAAGASATASPFPASSASPAPGSRLPVAASAPRHTQGRRRGVDHSRRRQVKSLHQGVTPKSASGREDSVTLAASLLECFSHPLGRAA